MQELESWSTWRPYWLLANKQGHTGWPCCKYSRRRVTGHITGWTVFKTKSILYFGHNMQGANSQQAWEDWSQWPKAPFHVSRLEEYRAACPWATGADHKFNFLESSTLLGKNRTFVQSVKISLIPKVSSHSRVLFVQQTFTGILCSKHWRCSNAQDRQRLQEYWFPFPFNKHLPSIAQESLTYTHMCTHSYIYMYVCVYIYIHTHKHTHT